MMHRSLPKHPSAALLLTLSLFVLDASAQNQALDLARDKSTDLHPSLREGLNTLGRYAETVNRQVNSLGGKRSDDTTLPDTPQPPLPRTVGGRRFESSNDPFEVSPQLREGRSANRYQGSPGASILELQRQVRLKALVITPQGRAAQLAINPTETITVMDRELIDLGDLGTFLVQIDRQGVTLLDPSMPQGKKVILR
nr:hypothetical protein [Rhodoferax sp.]